MKDRNNVEIRVGMTATVHPPGLSRGAGVVTKLSPVGVTVASRAWPANGWISCVPPNEVAVAAVIPDTYRRAALAAEIEGAGKGD